MIAIVAVLAVMALAAAGWFAARGRARLLRQDGARLRAVPGYHGWHVLLWVLVPGLVVLAVWSTVQPALERRAVLADPIAVHLPPPGMERDAIFAEARGISQDSTRGAFNPLSPRVAAPLGRAERMFGFTGALLAVVAGLAGGAFAFTRIRAGFPARTRVERATMMALLVASLIAVLTTLGIVASLLVESVRFFAQVSPLAFLTGRNWSPGNATPPNLDGAFGAVPLFWGTLYIGAIIAMLVAIPLGLMSAIYMTQYAQPRARRWLKPALEILAGVPTVVYGYFAALTLAPRIRDLAAWLGESNPSSESALAAGLVMGVMIIPFVSSMADDSLAAVPHAMRDGSLAMGATRSETIRRVLLPAALPGVVAGVILAISRAIGETMIVVMAAGASARLTADPFASLTTVTFQIVQLLTGDQEFDSPRTLSAFALGLVLFCITFALNIVALRVVRRFREAYE